ncbi:MAG: ASPIC/UnbV domain-containing protein, partial [Maritimibacter sp.]
EDGTFHEMALQAGVASLARSRGAALADLNLDGRLDLAVVNRKVAMEVYQNATLAQGHWLVLQLAQPGPDGNAVGAWIDMKVGDRMVSREITVGGAHATGVALPEHFGLGAADHVSLRVTWPDGQVSDWVETGVDQILRASRDGSSISLEKL